MKQQKMIAKQIQKGVKFYYKEVPDLYHDKKQHMILMLTIT